MKQAFASLAFAVAMGIFLLLLPSRTAQAWLGSLPFVASFAWVGLAFATASAWNFRGLVPPTRPAGPPLPLITPLNWALAAALLYCVLRSLTDGLNVDEHMQVSRYLLGLSNDGLNHFLSNRLTRWSLEMGGLSKTVARLPSVFFTLLLLFTLLREGRRDESFRPLVSWVLAHFLVNGILAVQLRSTRGYSGALFFCAVAYLLARRAVVTPGKNSSRPNPYLLAACLAVGALFHFFAVVFGACLLGSLAAYTYFRRDQLDEPHRAYCRKCLLIPLSLLPAATWLGYRQAVSLSTQGIWKNGLPSPLAWAQPLLVFGYDRAWAAKLAGVFFIFVFVAVTGGRRDWGKRLSFEGWFALISLVGLGVLIPALGVGSRVHARFFLPLLLPWLVWIVDSVRQIPKRAAYAFWVGAALFLILLPLIGRSALHSAESNDSGNLEIFFNEVKRNVGPLSEACYDCSGDWWICQWARFYLSDRFRRQYPDTCPKRYLLYLKANSPPGPNTWGKSLRYQLDGSYYFYEE